MKRDDDYIRALLFEAEETSEPYLLAPLAMSSSDEDLK